MFRIRFILIPVGIFFILFISFFIRGFLLSLEAEKTHLAYTIMLRVLKTYLEENSGNWPESWEEITEKQMDQTKLNLFSQCPKDFSDFRERVYIDYNLKGAQVAEMDIENFSAVRPIGPNYGPNETGIRELLEIARIKNLRKSEKGEP